MDADIAAGEAGFNPRPSHEGRLDFGDYMRADGRGFNPRPSHEGRLDGRGYVYMDKEFQSTPLA